MKTGSPKFSATLAALSFPLVVAGYLLVWPITSGSDSGSFLGIGITLVLALILISAFGPRMPRTRTFGDVALLSVPLVLYLIFCFIVTLTHADYKNFAWIMFGIALWIALLTNNSGKLPVLRGFKLVLYPALLIYMSSNISGILQFDGVGRGRVSFDNSAFTLTAYAVGSGLITALFSLIYGYGNRLISVAMVGISLLVVLSTGTRSIYMGIFLCLIIMLHFSKFRIISPKFILLVLLLVFAVIALTLVPTVGDRVDAVWEQLVSGATSFLGNTNNIEESAAGRFYNREFGTRMFWQNPFSGAGYKTLWLDFPVLQAFQDFGLFFGLLFFIAMVVVPVLFCFKLFRNGNQSQFFLCLIYVLNFPRLFLHGQPYDWVIFSYVLPVYSAMFSYRRNERDL